MIDTDGFRPNVGIILTNPEGSLFWARRVGNQNAWQFPQGGIQLHEDPEAALYRELEEEIGLKPEDVSLLGATRGWLRYRLPERLIRQREDGRRCIGQKQKWYLLELRSDDSAVRFDKSTEPPEFDRFEWVSYWYPVDKVVAFKRDVYRKALKELAPAHQSLMNR